MAADIPKEMSFGCSSIAIGPNNDVVAELVKKFDVKPVSIAMNDQLKDESSGKDDVSSLNFSTSQSTLNLLRCSSIFLTKTAKYS